MSSIVPFPEKLRMALQDTRLPATRNERAMAPESMRSRQQHGTSAAPSSAQLQTVRKPGTPFQKRDPCPRFELIDPCRVDPCQLDEAKETTRPQSCPHWKTKQKTKIAHTILLHTAW